MSIDRDDGGQHELENSDHKEFDAEIRDIVTLTPGEVADYQLAVLALQQTNQIPLHGQQEHIAHRIVQDIQRKLLVVSCDALTKELLPWEGGGTTTYDLEVGDEPKIQGYTAAYQTVDAYTRPSDKEALYQLVTTRSELRQQYEKLGLTYEYYDPRKLLIGGNIGSDATFLVWGMRQELSRALQRGKEQDILTVIHDITDYSSVLFAAVDLARAEMMGEDEPTPSAWQNFAKTARDTFEASRNLYSASPKLIIKFDNLLNAVHGAGPIVERFSVDGATSEGILAVLDATRNNNLDELIGMSNKMKTLYSSTRFLE